eukprot:CAMPEP_0172592578 /NCGR_PEP_ID=MMETSP1068-20121228/11592_1 /TAXON_ID=35684 /ORGANISM="Pseudopedinella elastica, Strain CCMP716" /LENGTH=214 /DNA_ID=CAMNT_0013389639 /DNA_START=66 /DNA_END=710 /DNA_ORIENTATION=-
MRSQMGQRVKGQSQDLSPVEERTEGEETDWEDGKPVDKTRRRRDFASLSSEYASTVSSGAASSEGAPGDSDDESDDGASENASDVGSTYDNAGAAVDDVGSTYDNAGPAVDDVGSTYDNAGAAVDGAALDEAAAPSLPIDKGVPPSSERKSSDSGGAAASLGADGSSHGGSSGAPSRGTSANLEDEEATTGAKKSARGSGSARVISVHSSVVAT